MLICFYTYGSDTRKYLFAQDTTCADSGLASAGYAVHSSYDTASRFLPPMTSGEGALLSAAIVAVWLTAAAIHRAKSMFNNS
jgi:hypothetical protein